MTNYDLTSIGAVSASAKLAHIRANQELEQSSYNAAWLHGYADALTNVADALEHQQELMDSIIGCMGEQYDSAELYDIEIIGKYPSYYNSLLRYNFQFLIFQAIAIRRQAGIKFSIHHPHFYTKAHIF